MIDIRCRVLAATLTGVLTVLTVLTGCSGGNAAGGNAARSGSPGGTAAGMVVSRGDGMFSPAQLEKALLTRVNGVGPLAKPDAGSYTALPEVHAATARMTGVSVTPEACVEATLPQVVALDTGALGTAPTALVNFRVGGNGVTEVMASPADATTAAALGKPIPANCAHYSESVSGRTFKYAVRQDWLPGVGRQPARVLDIVAIGQRKAASVWSLFFQGAGFVGAITVQGPNASEAVVRELGQQAYAYAWHSLGG